MNFHVCICICFLFLCVIKKKKKKNMPCSRHHPYQDPDCEECCGREKGGCLGHILGWLLVILLVALIIYLCMSSSSKEGRMGCGCSSRSRFGTPPVSLKTSPAEKEQFQELSAMIDDILE